MRGRRVLALLSGLTVLGSLPACGADLGKANFPRTTVSAQPAGSRQIPTGEITDAAVATPALRVVDPCPLVDKTALADLGTPGETSSSDFDRCSNEVKDAGGKPIRIAIRIGDLPIVSKVNGTVEGLPQIAEKPDGARCATTAVTSKTPELGITIQVTYEDGDPCRTGVTVLQKVIKRLRDGPLNYDLPAGTVLPLDACAGIDDQVVKELAPATKKLVIGLHGCLWAGSGPELQLNYRRALPPAADRGYQKVDLGGGVSGFQRLQRDNGSRCTIEWQHRAVNNNNGEIVSADYTNYDADAAKDDPCGKALKVAKNVTAKLPKP